MIIVFSKVVKSNGPRRCSADRPWPPDCCGPTGSFVVWVLRDCSDVEATRSAWLWWDVMGRPEGDLGWLPQWQLQHKLLSSPADVQVTLALMTFHIRSEWLVSRQLTTTTTTTTDRDDLDDFVVVAGDRCGDPSLFRWINQHTRTHTHLPRCTTTNSLSSSSSSEQQLLLLQIWDRRRR